MDLIAVLVIELLLATFATVFAAFLVFLVFLPVPDIFIDLLMLSPLILHRWALRSGGITHRLVAGTIVPNVVLLELLLLLLLLQVGDLIIF